MQSSNCFLSFDVIVTPSTSRAHFGREKRFTTLHIHLGENALYYTEKGQVMLCLNFGSISVIDETKKLEAFVLVTKLDTVYGTAIFHSLTCELDRKTLVALLRYISRQKSHEQLECPRIIREAECKKRGKIRRTDRYMVLANSHLLVYRVKDDEFPLNGIFLATVKISSAGRTGLLLSVDKHRKFEFLFESRDEKDLWKDLIYNGVMDAATRDANNPLFFLHNPTMEAQKASDEVKGKDEAEVPPANGDTENDPPPPPFPGHVSYASSGGDSVVFESRNDSGIIGDSVLDASRMSESYGDALVRVPSHSSDQQGPHDDEPEEFKSSQLSIVVEGESDSIGHVEIEGLGASLSDIRAVVWELQGAPRDFVFLANGEPIDEEEEDEIAVESFLPKLYLREVTGRSEQLLLRIYIEGSNVELPSLQIFGGHVTLFDIREIISEFDECPPEFSFIVDGVPVGKRQENKLPAVDCLPAIYIRPPARTTANKINSLRTLTKPTRSVPRRPESLTFPVTIDDEQLQWDVEPRPRGSTQHRSSSPWQVPSDSHSPSGSPRQSPRRSQGPPGSPQTSHRRSQGAPGSPQTSHRRSQGTPGSPESSPRRSRGSPGSPGTPRRVVSSAVRRSRPNSPRIQPLDQPPVAPPSMPPIMNSDGSDMFNDIQSTQHQQRQTRRLSDPPIAPPSMPPIVDSGRPSSGSSTKMDSPRNRTSTNFREDGRATCINVTLDGEQVGQISVNLDNNSTVSDLRKCIDEMNVIESDFLFTRTQRHFPPSKEAQAPAPFVVDFQENGTFLHLVSNYPQQQQQIQHKDKKLYIKLENNHPLGMIDLAIEGGAHASLYDIRQVILFQLAGAPTSFKFVTKEKDIVSDETSLALNYLPDIFLRPITPPTPSQKKKGPVFKPASSLPDDDKILYIHKTHSRTPPIGFVDLSIPGTDQASLHDVRVVVCSQLAAIPERFIFLLNGSTRVREDQEMEILAIDHLPRLCVLDLDNPDDLLKYTMEENALSVSKSTVTIAMEGDYRGLGSLDVIHNMNLEDFREELISELGPSLPFSNFQFLSVDGVPIGLATESRCNVEDCLNNEYIFIRPQTRAKRASSAYGIRLNVLITDTNTNVGTIVIEKKKVPLSQVRHLIIRQNLVPGDFRFFVNNSAIAKSLEVTLPAAVLGNTASVTLTTDSPRKQLPPIPQSAPPSSPPGGRPNGRPPLPPISVPRNNEQLELTISVEGHPNPIGIIDVDSMSTSLTELRKIMLEELDEIPKHFAFLRNGIPVSTKQEQRKRLSQLHTDGVIQIRTKKERWLTADVQTRSSSRSRIVLQQELHAQKEEISKLQDQIVNKKSDLYASQQMVEQKEDHLGSKEIYRLKEQLQNREQTEKVAISAMEEQLKAQQEQISKFMEEMKAVKEQRPPPQNFVPGQVIAAPPPPPQTVHGAIAPPPLDMIMAQGPKYSDDEKAKRSVACSKPSMHTSLHTELFNAIVVSPPKLRKTGGPTKRKPELTPIQNALSVALASRRNVMQQRRSFNAAALSVSVAHAIQNGRERTDSDWD